ncbi:MAG: hypothetical protein GX657_16045 [Chloroflexi bacterium]|nr:hypothetical protein [Chloroflexota bacterium]
MGFLDDAIQASKEEEERATERAREYEERDRANREGTLRETFEADFGREPARVDPGDMTATLEGLTLHLRQYHNTYHVVTDHHWSLRWTCPACGEYEYSGGFHDLAGLGAAALCWHPEEGHRCPPTEDDELDPDPEPAPAAQDTEVYELVSLDSQLATVIRGMIGEELVARNADVGF